MGVPKAALRVCAAAAGGSKSSAPCLCIITRCCKRNCLLNRRIPAKPWPQVESVKLLLEKGADKSVKNMDGKTALEVATLNEQADVAAALA